jgi:ribosome-binding protein aMBF1 (putative translation factor)
LTIMTVSGTILPMTKRAKLSDQVRQAIRASGMSCYAICKRLDFSESVMSKFMRGRCGLSLETIDRLGDLLGLEIVARRPKKRRR